MLRTKNHVETGEPHLVYTYGHDQILGNYIQICDSRFAKTEEDSSGKGLLFDWDGTFGIDCNHIEATIADVKAGAPVLVKKAKHFMKTII